MVNALCLNSLSSVDTAFFIICAVIIVLIIAIYFLIPVFNKKLYQEQRDNLHKREAAFKSNIQGSQSEETKEEPEAENAEKPENTEVSADE